MPKVVAGFKELIGEGEGRLKLYLQQTIFTPLPSTPLLTKTRNTYNQGHRLLRIVADAYEAFAISELLRKGCSKILYMSPKPATLLALQKTGYAQFIGWRKEVYHYDGEVKAHSQDLPVKDMYWCSKDTPTKDSLLECLNKHSPDAILMVDTAYYDDYN